MKDLREMTVTEMTHTLWSDAPAPGGGSMSALAGGLAAGLAGMVANLSQSAKYEAVREEMADIAARMEVLYKQLLLEMQRDTDSFSLYMAALAMPKATEEEKAARRDAMQAGLKAAAETPLGVAQAIVPVFEVLERVIRVGNPNAVTDALVGTMMARTGILGALFNVKINLGGIKDEAYVQAMQEKVRTLEIAALEGERRVLALSEIASGVASYAPAEMKE
jgi:formiminotetrahydrofolate cyclodeaminase